MNLIQIQIKCHILRYAFLFPLQGWKHFKNFKIPTHTVKHHQRNHEHNSHDSQDAVFADEMFGFVVTVDLP